jgi:diacylglycerol O-acyltransferase
MSAKRRVPPQDAMFLWTETPETMMHVASLMPFTPPADAGPTYLRDVLDEAREDPVLSPWNMKLTHPFLLRHPRQAWVEDENFDFDYHVRRSALASPGDERELGILISRLHSHQLDFTRPPWELHVIEGLEGGRFALYVKVHHALVDGVTAV